MEPRVLVWDLPTRAFHWLFAGSFLAAFTIAQVVDDDDEPFRLHMLLGGVLALLVVLRGVWGLVGSRHARFGAFLYGPRAVADYLTRALRREEKPCTGHNPGASVAIVLLLTLGLGVAVTGALMSTYGKPVKKLHELFANVMLGVVVVHVAGVVWHTVRHRENLARSMLDGRKTGDPEQAIRSTHPLVAAALLALVGLWTTGLVRGYDRAAGAVTLPLVGVTIPLNDGKQERERHRPRERD